MPDAMPRGSGHIPADAQCDGAENRRAAKDGGRRPAIKPRSDCAIEGDDAGAETLMSLEERPGAFRKSLRKRNNAGGAFSPINEGFGGAARAAKANAWTAELPPACTLHDVAFARGLQYGGGDGPRMRGPRPNVSKPHETGPGAGRGGSVPPFQAGRPANGVAGLMDRWILDRAPPGPFQPPNGRPHVPHAAGHRRPPTVGRSRASLSRRSARRRPPPHRGRPAHPAFDLRPHLRRQGAIIDDVYLYAVAHGAVSGYDLPHRLRRGRSHGRGPSLLTDCMESILIVLNQHIYRENFILCNRYYISNENDTV